MPTRMNTAIETIDEYIAGYPGNTQALLKKMRVAIQQAAPKAKEKIAYGIPTFYTEQGNLVHFGGFKSHIGFYPGHGGIVMFKKELAGYTTSKGAVQFPTDKPIPVTLVKQVVKFRLAQQRETGKVKK